MLPLQKPTLWNINPGILEYNCRKYGMPVPVVAMPMWEGAGGIVYDFSGCNNHSSINGADWVANGLLFDSADTGDYIDLGNASILNFINNYTISFRINPTDDWNSDSSDSSIVDSGLHGGVGQPLYHSLLKIDADNTDQLQYVTRNAGATKVVNCSKSNWDANTWYDIVIVHDSSNNIKWYINGTIDNTVAFFPLDTTNYGGYHIGKRSTGAFDYYNGIVNSVAFYNMQLSSTQVKFLHDDPYFMFRVPDELYGYAAAAGVSIPVLIHQMQQQGIL